MRACERFEIGARIALAGAHGTLAFDGEREIELERGDRYEITLDHDVSRRQALRHVAMRDLDPLGDVRRRLGHRLDAPREHVTVQQRRVGRGGGSMGSPVRARNSLAAWRLG